MCEKRDGRRRQVLEDVQWPDEFPFTAEDFKRYDESPDTFFYVRLLRGGPYVLAGGKRGMSLCRCVGPMPADGLGPSGDGVAMTAASKRGRWPCVEERPSGSQKMWEHGGNANMSQT